MRAFDRYAVDSLALYLFAPKIIHNARLTGVPDGVRKTIDGTCATRYASWGACSKTTTEKLYRYVLFVYPYILRRIDFTRPSMLTAFAELVRPHVC